MLRSRVMRATPWALCTLVLALAFPALVEATWHSNGQGGNATFGTDQDAINDLACFFKARCAAQGGQMKVPGKKVIR